MTHSLEDFASVREIVYRHMPATPHFNWPLLSNAVGVETIVKHENHTPTGAFKVRGGLVYMERLKARSPNVTGVISATRGNHGQSIAFAATKAGLDAVVVVPRNNSVEKNAAMRAFGAEVIEFGADFDEAKAQAGVIAKERQLHFVPSFHDDLVLGVGTYGLELFEAFRSVDVVYVPIGLGSGICGTIAARDALGLTCEIVGVVNENARAYALSFEAGRLIETNSAQTFADGMAVRIPDARALEIIQSGAARIVTVSDEETAEAMRVYYSTIHSIAEGAGAAPLAALMQEKEQLKGKQAAVILSGQNIDKPWYQSVLDGKIPL